MSAGLVKEVFKTVDGMDADGFASFFADDCRLCFGNSEPMIGRAAIRDGIAGFFASIDGLRHDVSNVWEQTGTFIVETQVTYNRKDGGIVTVPAISILDMTGQGRISDYRIYVDLAPLFG